MKESASSASLSHFQMMILPDEVSVNKPDKYKNVQTTVVLYRQGEDYSFLLCDQNNNLLHVIPITDSEEDKGS